MQPVLYYIFYLTELLFIFKKYKYNTLSRFFRTYHSEIVLTTIVYAIYQLKNSINNVIINCILSWSSSG